MRKTRLRPVVWVFIAVVGLATARTAVAQSKEPYPGFDSYVAKAMQTWKIPGLSIAIVRNDSVIYAKGFGVASARGHAPVNERTLFEIGSSSKAFTATGVSPARHRTTTPDYSWKEMAPVAAPSPIFH